MIEQSTARRAGFAPRIEVLSEQPAQLQPADRSWEAILAHFPGLAEAKAVCLTGSTAAGWGNEFSDIDLYAFSDKELVLPDDETSETGGGSGPHGLSWFAWIGRYGDARVDLQVWPTDALPRALSRYVEGEPEFHSNKGPIADFIYRMSIGIPLKNADYFAEMRELLERSCYRRAIARAAKVEAENCLTDVAGLLESGDDITARQAATLAAGYVADHCLTLAGELCRRKKWLFRRLAATPECGITPGEYRTEVMEGRRPGETDRDVAIRVARWAQSHLVRVEGAVLVTV